MRLASIGVAVLALAASSALAQDRSADPQAPLSTTNRVAPPAPVGHRQPTAKDLPPDVAKKEGGGDAANSANPEARPEPAPLPSAVDLGPSRPGGPPQLEVRTSCKAAARGAVMLGRDENACLADESAALGSLRQSWDKYSATDKSQCVGMTRTGGPASYVELLSCLEVMRDARNLQNAELESDEPTVNPARRKRR
jgi:hypothetical protein